MSDYERFQTFMFDVELKSLLGCFEQIFHAKIRLAFDKNERHVSQCIRPSELSRVPDPDPDPERNSLETT